jgi:VIT1/CCC1 family predicted Fe2+/Mn2+ transporter
MDQNQEVAALLKQIEANQREAIDLQKQHLELAKAQLERSNQSITESLSLQRTAVARQSQLTKILLPIVGVLLILLVYLMVRWNIL